MGTKTSWAGRRGIAWLGVGALGLALAAAQAQHPAAIPDAPKPHVDLPTADVTPGSGTSSSSNSSSPVDTAAPAQTPAPATPPAQTSALPQPAGQSEPVHGPTGENAPTIGGLGVYEVNIPFIVKDAKGKIVPNIRQPEVRVFENGRPMRLVNFVDEGDFHPLSVAIVIDQSMTREEMDTVNTALSALQGAFSNYDEVSIFTYNKSPKLVTEFTGAQSPRATQAIEISKASGRDALLPGSLSGPMAQNIVINDQNFDPNTSSHRGTVGMAINPPREVHPLYDAILQAASSLSTQPIERRRIVYVISNGNEFGSKTTGKQLLTYLKTNGIEVDGTLVGIQTSLPVVGMLDRIHLPLQMRDNVLKPLSDATGGNVDAEFRASAIERGFAKIVGEARNRYIATWDSPEPFYDGKVRSIDITILRPGLTVIAQPSYYPQSQERRPRRPEPTPAQTVGPAIMH